MTEPTQHPGDAENTTPIPPYTPSYAQQSYSPPSYTSPTPPAGSSPSGRNGRSRTATAAVLTAALLLGAGGGIAGAAAYDALEGDTATTTASSTTSDTTSDSTSSNAAAPPASDTNGSAPMGSAEQVAAAVLPSVVKITVVAPDGSGGSGSGIVLSSDGEILTNNHVAEVAQGGKMTVSFNDGHTADATVVGTDPVTDLAVVQAKGVSGLTPARIGNSDALRVGDSVVAIGSPFGLDATVTSGIVSALNRPVAVSSPTTGGEDTIYPAIQTDAAINPGNSGGPLVNSQGQVVGIDSSIRTSSSGMGGEGGSIGLGFAIPISQVMPVVDQLRNGQTPTHARLGVTVSNKLQDGLPMGAGIESVEPGSAGQQAGLKSGDVVLKVDDKVISSVDSLVATIRGYRPGDQVALTVQRGSDTLTLHATLDSDVGTKS